jgi:hypothetical protein
MFAAPGLVFSRVISRHERSERPGSRAGLAAIDCI